MKTKISSVSEQFDDRQSLAVQDSGKRIENAINRVPYKTSSVSPPLAFAGGDQKVWYHGLGRTPARWALDDITTGPAAVYRVSWDAQKITFAATLACTVVVRAAVD